MSDRLNAEPPRSRLPLVLVALVAVVILVAATVAATNVLGGDEPDPPTTSASSASSGESSPASSPVSTGSAAGASGCLGGVNPTAAVLTAQKEAPLDGKGAAAFAATVMRWRSQYPVDPDYATKARQVMSPDAGSELLTLDPPKAGEQDSVWGSTEGARYRVSEISDSSATVEMTMPFFATTKEYPDGVEVSSAARWRLVADGGRWRVADMDALDENDPARAEVDSNGMSYKGVC